MKKYLLIILLSLPLFALAQITITQTPTGASGASTQWFRGGNTTSPNTNNIFGTLWNSEVHHFTNGLRRFSTTTNNGLTNASFNRPIATGDGISIHTNGANSGAFASIDLFTGASNSTYLRMGQAFLTQTSNNRVEQIANFNGFWYNATNVYAASTPQFIWNINQVEKGRLGQNGWWKFGNNPTNLLSGNIVEISTTNAIGNPYGTINSSGLRLRNLTAASPALANGTNGLNSSKLLSVDGNGDVVLTSPLSISASNNGLQTNGSGLVQLGGQCGNATEEFNSRLLIDRKLPLSKYNLIFYQPGFASGTSAGRVGIGDLSTCAVGNLLEVTKFSTSPSISGVSGLRLGDLRGGSFVQPANGRALSVDGNGDVILVQSPVGGGGVSLCLAAPINNVVKVSAVGTSICQTNITDLFPIGTVGINNLAPNDGLDVSPPAAGNPGTGDIDVTSAVNRYEINDQPVLWHKGNTTDLFVGVGAGAAATITGNNTFVGNNTASTNAVVGFNNTMIGKEAGQNIFGSMDFTFVGYRAGAQHPGFFYSNTFIGSRAGENETGAENVYVGYFSGNNPSAGFALHNAFLGDWSGGSNTNGSSNTFLGYQSGAGNINGNNNTAVGDFSGFANPNLNNASAIGSNAQTVNSDQMILGNNAVNVGIGLSGNASGPQNKLEINTTPGSPYFGSPNGSSGLRLRNMPSTVIPVPNPGFGVLSVDASGDVIYVDAPPSTGGIAFCSTFPPPANNVVKATANPNEVCQTNITDLHPIGYDGINFTAPNDAIDVGISCTTCLGDGNIDITDMTSRLEIGDQPILWHKGLTSNLYLGVGAGLLIPTGAGAGVDNTIIGNNAYSNWPTNNLSNNRNVIVGSEAASNFAFGGVSDVVYVGYRAGKDADGVNNTYIGCQAGENNAPGADENVFVGWHTGKNNSGLHNVFIGNLSGQNNAGFQNTFVGIGSGQNAAGAFNISLGGGSGPLTGGISNSGSIGNGVNARNSNQMLLGDNLMNVGIGLNTDIPGPQTKLEIDAGLAGTNAGGNFGIGNSGLRFRDLTSLSIPQPNPGNGVLGLNALGDVIYVNPPIGGGGGIGNYCGSALNPLTFHYQVPTNNFRYSFTGQGIINATQKDNVVSVGYSCAQNPPSHFSVLDAQTGGPTQETFAGHFQNDNVSMLGFNYITSGVYAEARAPQSGFIVNPPINIGGVFEGYGTQACIGTFGRICKNSIPYPGSTVAPFARYAIGGAFMSDTVTTNPFATSINIGVYAHASNSITSNVGVYTHVPLATNPSAFYALWASSPVGPSNLAAYIDGDITINGVGNIPAAWIVSDKRFKKDIHLVENALSTILKLKPSSYSYMTKNPWGMNLPEGKSLGFIAQELEEVVPEAVRSFNKLAEKDADGKIIKEAINYKAVNYDAIVPVVVKGIQEQEQNIQILASELEEQKKLNRDLIARLELLEKNMTALTNTKNQETTIGQNIDEIILNQNVPNPFSEKTIISYNIPQQSQTAFIYFYAGDGKVLQKTILNQKGKGEITVYASNLSSGIYTYSLIVDGKKVDSKRMTVSK